MGFVQNDREMLREKFEILVRREDRRSVSHSHGANKEIRIGALHSLRTAKVEKLCCCNIVLTVNGRSGKLSRCFRSFPNWDSLRMPERISWRMDRSFGRDGRGSIAAALGQEQGLRCLPPQRERPHTRIDNDFHAAFSASYNHIQDRNRPSKHRENLLLFQLMDVFS